MKRWFLSAPLAIVPTAAAATRKIAYEASIAVEIRRMRQRGKSFYAVNAKGFASAAPQAVWNVLTGYDRLHEFVPNLQTSKLLSRDGREAIIEQTARAGFLFFRQSIYLEMRVVERPISKIDIALLSGDLKQFVSHWEIAAARQGAANGTLITYSGKLEPNFFIPPLLGAPLIRADVRNMVVAVIKEIEKSG